MSPTSRTERVGDIEVGQDLRFQRKEWVFQRIGWGVMILLVVAAALGLFGGMGVFAKQTLGTPTDPMRVEYHRFDRHRAPSEMNIYLAAGLADPADSTVRIWLDREYIQATTVEHLSPEPDGVETSADRITYQFKITDPSRPATISLEIRPVTSGQRFGRIGLEDGPSFSFRQFVFP